MTGDCFCGHPASEHHRGYKACCASHPEYDYPICNCPRFEEAAASSEDTLSYLCYLRDIIADNARATESGGAQTEPDEFRTWRAARRSTEAA